MLPRLQDGGSNQPSSSITSKAQGPLTDLGIWRGCGGYSCAHRSPCSCNAMARGDGGTGVTPDPASEVVGELSPACKQLRPDTAHPTHRGSSEPGTVEYPWGQGWQSTGHMQDRWL